MAPRLPNPAIPQGLRSQWPSPRLGPSLSGPASSRGSRFGRGCPTRHHSLDNRTVARVTRVRRSVWTGAERRLVPYSGQISARATPLATGPTQQASLGARSAQDLRGDVQAVALRRHLATSFAEVGLCLAAVGILLKVRQGGVGSEHTRPRRHSGAPCSGPFLPRFEHDEPKDRPVYGVLGKPRPSRSRSSSSLRSSTTPRATASGSSAGATA